MIEEQSWVRMQPSCSRSALKFAERVELVVEEAECATERGQLRVPHRHFVRKHTAVTRKMDIWQGGEPYIQLSVIPNPLAKRHE
jgi:hypothetical protein